MEIQPELQQLFRIHLKHYIKKLLNLMMLNIHTSFHLPSTFLLDLKDLLKNGSGMVGYHILTAAS